MPPKRRLASSSSTLPYRRSSSRSMPFRRYRRYRRSKAVSGATMMVKKAKTYSRGPTGKYPMKTLMKTTLSRQLLPTRSPPKTFTVRGVERFTTISLFADTWAVLNTEAKMSVNLDSTAFTELFCYDVLALKAISFHVKVSNGGSDNMQLMTIGTVPLYGATGQYNSAQFGGGTLGALSSTDISRLKSSNGYINHTQFNQAISIGFDRAIKPLTMKPLFCQHISYINAVQNDADTWFPNYEVLPPFRPRAVRDLQANNYTTAYRTALFTSDYGPAPVIDTWTNISLPSLAVIFDPQFGGITCKVAVNVTYEFTGYGYNPNEAPDTPTVAAHLVKPPAFIVHQVTKEAAGIDCTPVEEKKMLSVDQPVSGPPSRKMARTTSNASNVVPVVSTRRTLRAAEALSQMSVNSEEDM